MPARIAVITLVGCLLAGGPARLSLAAEGSDHVPPPAGGVPDIDARVDALVLHHRLTFEETDKARQLGEAGLSRLSAILADSALQESWPTATHVIGLIGGRRSFEILRDFIWSRFHGPVDGLTHDALTSAVVALGYTSDPDTALVSLLEAHADPAAWADIPWTTYDVSDQVNRILLSNYAIAALGYCRSAEAGQALRRLSRNPALDPGRIGSQAARILGASIATAIKTHDQVMKLGLREYWISTEDPRLQTIDK